VGDGNEYKSIKLLHSRLPFLDWLLAVMRHLLVEMWEYQFDLISCFNMTVLKLARVINWFGLKISNVHRKKTDEYSI
jgi:hypothetical protein